METLISILVLALVLGVVVWLIQLVIDALPMEGTFKQIAKGLVILIALLMVLAKALPLLGVPVPF